MIRLLIFAVGLLVLPLLVLDVMAVRGA